MKAKEEDKKKKRVKHILIGSGIGLGVIGLGIGWWYLFGRKDDKLDEETERELIKKTSYPSENLIKPTNNTPRTLPKAIQDKAQTNSFPIKYGDKGSLVKQFQEGLIKLYGKKILPNYGADGSYKKEMDAALKSKGLPLSIDKATFDKIVSGKPASTSAPTPGKLPLQEGIDIAKNIWLNAALKKNEGMVTQLQRIRNLQDYKMVDALMKTVGQRKPIADIAIIAANDDTGLQLIAIELKRIGLKYKDEKWVLAGIEPAQIITSQPTTIRDKSGIGINVPAETLLGEVISNAGAVTTFRTIDDQILYVPTKHINHV